MKLSAKIMKDADLGYLYSVNGACKLVLRHSETHAQAGKVEWVTIHDTDIKPGFSGRLVIHRRGAIRLAMMAQYIKATAPSIDDGSENTKSRGIAVGSINFQLGDSPYQDSFHVNLLDGLISSDFTYQPENAWIDPKYEAWGGYRIAA